MPMSAKSAAELLLDRRRFLQLVGAASAMTALPAMRRAAAGLIETPSTGLFLTADEYAVIEAATARIFPSDETPGAPEANVAAYIQRYLSMTPTGDANCDGRVTAADPLAETRAIGAGASDCPAADVDGNGRYDEADLAAVQRSLFGPVEPIFAGGPFSGRTPFIDPTTMMPSNEFPPDSYVDFVPLNRVQAIGWRARLEGTAGTPELSGNPLASGSRVNLRKQYRDGIAVIEAQSQATFGMSFVELTPAQQTQILARPAVATFMRQLRAQTMEGMFSAPEYGGNREAVGWTLIGYGGDRQPLGYTWGFDEDTQTYVEDPQRPNSTPNPGETCVGLSPAVLTLVKTLVGSQPHYTVFDDPFCFGVLT